MKFIFSFLFVVLINTGVNSHDVTCGMMVQMASDMYCDACSVSESTLSCYKKLRSVGVSDFIAESHCELGESRMKKKCHDSNFLRKDLEIVFLEMVEFYDNEFNISCTEEFQNLSSNFNHCVWKSPEGKTITAEEWKSPEGKTRTAEEWVLLVILCIFVTSLIAFIASILHFLCC